MFPRESGSGGADVDRGSAKVTLHSGGKATDEVTYLGTSRDEDVSKVHKSYTSD